MVPIRSVYVPRLSSAFGFSCIDVVLQCTVGEDVSVRPRAVTATRESKGASIHPINIIKKNLYCESRESKSSYQVCTGSGPPMVTATADIGINGISAVQGMGARDPFSSDRSGGYSLTMKDSDGVSVKVDFIDKIKYDTIQDNINENRTRSKSNTVQIFFKMIHIKSSFANQITCLLVTEMTEFVLLRYPNMSPHEQVRIVTQDGREITSLITSHIISHHKINI